MVLQRVGARFWITRIMITWGLLSIAMLFVKTPNAFYVLRFLLGMAEAGFYPGVVLYMTYWFPSYARSQGMAWFNLGIAMAGVLGSPLSGWIMQTFAGYGGMAGWQWLFLLEGLPAVLLGIAVYFYLDDRPGNVRWLTPEQNARVVQQLAAQRQAQEAAGASHNFRAAFVNKSLWCLIYVNFALLCGTYGVSFWLPQIVQGLGVKGLFHTGLIAAIPFAVASVAMVLVSRHSDKTRERRWHGTLCNLASAQGLAIAAYFHDQPVLSLAGLSLAMSGGLAGFCVLWALPGVLLTGTAAAAGIALIATVGNLGGYASPFMLGWVKQSSGHLEYGLYVLAAMTLLGAFVMFRVKLPSARVSSAVGEASVI
ncbi:MFS transporter [Pseudomonas sp. S35]|jgi:MFS family permease|uniref:MFS transporter n=1 Tax=Pseudomonas sp. S35 TaxID=1573719 RepID=UPI001EEC2246|nr:MFS transporter [Pseudomonas sp. S35]